ncbi:peptide chain release factor N(5)-glutamine methyltransferase [Piscinibacter defluvii]|uniref:peptide chain release factor N(5)-glutamine methyltransferase n=1 Tax=Piscinibacter defluvii TaxID=1796922 RepID=UPI000FDCF63A|nr:peptide chain release factor N(5)-glutamine methyltransferase [Piscinibacter defluvii]
MTTIAQALAAARRRGVDRLDAQLLLAQLLGCERAWLLAHDDEPLTAGALAQFEARLARRAAGEPLAYLTGTREFHGLALAVDARVLVPRPDTETLVDWALERLAALALPAPRVLDLGTGSGAIALAVKQAHPAARVTATDASAGALEVAGSNARRLGLDIELCTGSWWQAVAGRRFDLVLSNPPYVRSDDPHLAGLSHEPRTALTPGPTGLEAFEAIAGGACEHLAPGAWLLLEHGWDQAAALRLLLARHGLTDPATRRDLSGHERCTGARASAQ